MSQLTYGLDRLALTGSQLAGRRWLSELATDRGWWPTVARLRAFGGVDTLTALAIHLELGAAGSALRNPLGSGAGSA